MIEIAEERVESGFVFLHISWLVEEVLGGDGKELGFVGSPVLVQVGRKSPASALPQGVELGVADFNPASQGFAILQKRGAIGGAVQHVEFVRELVVDDVVALLGVTRVSLDRVPHEDHRPPELCLTQDRNARGCLKPGDFEAAALPFGGNDGAGVNENRGDVGVELMGQTQGKKAGLTRDGHPDLIVEDQPAAALPALFGDEDLDEIPKPGFLRVVELRVMGDIRFQYVEPRRWKRSVEAFAPFAFLEPADDVELLVKVCGESALPCLKCGRSGSRPPLRSAGELREKAEPWAVSGYNTRPGISDLAGPHFWMPGARRAGE